MAIFKCFGILSGFYRRERKARKLLMATEIKFQHKINVFIERINSISTYPDYDNWARGVNGSLDILDENKEALLSFSCNENIDIDSFNVGMFSNISKCLFESGRVSFELENIPEKLLEHDTNLYTKQDVIQGLERKLYEFSEIHWGIIKGFSDSLRGSSATSLTSLEKEVACYFKLVLNLKERNSFGPSEPSPSPPPLNLCQRICFGGN